MSEKIGIKSLNGHPLVDEDVRKRVTALEESGGSGGSAGGGRPVVLFMKDGTSLNPKPTAAEIFEMMSYSDGVPLPAAMPEFMLSDGNDLSYEGSAMVMPMIPCVRNDFVVDGPTMSNVGMRLHFYGIDDYYIVVDFANNKTEIKSIPV